MAGFQLSADGRFWVSTEGVEVLWTSRTPRQKAQMWPDFGIFPIGEDGTWDHLGPKPDATIAAPICELCDFPKGKLEAPPGFEPGMRFADRGRSSILLTRLVFWLALLPTFAGYLGVVVPKWS